MRKVIARSSQLAMALLEQPDGHYLFVPGGPGSPYCSGVVAAPGYEVVHATLRQSLPWREGFALVDRYLVSIGRSRASLCAIELRAARPYTPDHWTGPGSFNQEYIDLLNSWGLFVDRENPVARTNVAPGLGPPAEQVLFAFSYTVPARGDDASPSFVAAGSGEDPTVRPGETTPDALRAKTRNVMATMRARLAALGARWEDVTAVDVYTVHDFSGFLEAEILAPLGAAARHGIHWYYSRPPIDDREVEIDLRGVRQEIQIG